MYQETTTVVVNGPSSISIERKHFAFVLVPFGGLLALGLGATAMIVGGTIFVVVGGVVVGVAAAATSAAAITFIVAGTTTAAAVVPLAVAPLAIAATSTAASPVVGAALAPVVITTAAGTAAGATGVGVFAGVRGLARKIRRKIKGEASVPEEAEPTEPAVSSSAQHLQKLGGDPEAKVASDKKKTKSLSSSRSLSSSSSSQPSSPESGHTGRCNDDPFDLWRTRVKDEGSSRSLK